MSRHCNDCVYSEGEHREDGRRVIEVAPLLVNKADYDKLVQAYRDGKLSADQVEEWLGFVPTEEEAAAHKVFHYREDGKE